MLYLSPISGELRLLRHRRLGCMRTMENDRGVPDGMLWAADNGCYTRGERFDPCAWLAWLERLRPDRATCLFAVAPDVVGDAEATRSRSAPYLPLLRAMGYQAAYVAQDGFDPEAVDWDAFDVLFIGGTTAWKRAERGGYAAIAEGKRHGKSVHVGRVNGGPFLRNVAMAGADSADGTGLAINPGRNWAQILRWFAALDTQPALWHGET